MSRSREELLAETARFQEILDSGVRERLAALPGVTQVSIGLKEVGGRPTRDFSVKVYVEEKLPVERLAPEHVVPATVTGVPTDVCPRPNVVLETTVHGGMKITNGIADSDHKTPPTIVLEVGTLGFVARRNEKPYKPVMLSNAHVLGAHGGTKDDQVFHPEPAAEPFGPLPHKPTKSTNRVGIIVSADDIKNNDFVDAAIAEVTTCYSCRCNCGTGFSHTIPGLAVNGSDELTGTDLAVIGLDVVKVGQKTGRTAGMIVDVGIDFPIAGRVYKDQIKILSSEAGKPFTLGGDSGSVIVDFQGNVVGLHMGGDDLPPGADPATKASYANRIQRVMDALHIWFPSHPKPSATATVAAAVAEPAHVDEAGLFDLLTERLGTSEVGRRLRDVIITYGREIVELVNHRRRVTVAWHRGQGPTWIAAFARSARHPDYRLPVEIDGVTRVEVVSALHTVLLVEGSDELRAQLRDLPDFLAPALAECESVGELLDRLGQTAEQRN